MVGAKRFRFGVHFNHNATREELRTRASQAEDLGYSTFLIADHVWVFPAIAGMAAAAEATTSLRIGTDVLGNDFRHPALLAREAAAIDLISNGRLELGLDTGYAPSEYQRLGIQLDAPNVRVSRLEEAVQIIKGLWTSNSFSFSGRYYSIENLECIPKPVQNPHPPLLVGGGSKRILSLAAREANIIGINFRTTVEGGFDFPSLSHEATSEKVEWVRQAAGTRFNDLELSMLIPFAAITNNREAAAEQLAARFKQMNVQSEQLFATPHALIGSVDQIVADLQERRERYGISYIILFEDQLDAFASVVARLAGT
jgi:probable F420-dependent oxidoreductase